MKSIPLFSIRELHDLEEWFHMKASSFGQRRGTATWNKMSAAFLKLLSYYPLWFADSLHIRFEIECFWKPNEEIGETARQIKLSLCEISTKILLNDTWTQRKANMLCVFSYLVVLAHHYIFCIKQLLVFLVTDIIPTVQWLLGRTANRVNNYQQYPKHSLHV